MKDNSFRKVKWTITAQYVLTFHKNFISKVMKVHTTIHTIPSFFSQTLYKGMNEGTIDPKRMRKVLNYIDRKRNKISQESH